MYTVRPFQSPLYRLLFSVSSRARTDPASDELLEEFQADLEGEDLDSAQAILERMVDEAPGHSSTWMALGQLAEETGDDECAEASYLRAVQMGGGRAAIFAVGALYHALGRDEEALHRFRSLLADDLRDDEAIAAQKLTREITGAGRP